MSSRGNNIEILDMTGSPPRRRRTAVEDTLINIDDIATNVSSSSNGPLVRPRRQLRRSSRKLGFQNPQVPDGVDPTKPQWDMVKQPAPGIFNDLFTQKTKQMWDRMRDNRFDNTGRALTPYIGVNKSFVIQARAARKYKGPALFRMESRRRSVLVV